MEASSASIRVKFTLLTYRRFEDNKRAKKKLKFIWCCSHSNNTTTKKKCTGGRYEGRMY